MNSIHFERCLLCALLAVRICSAQATMFHVQLPVCELATPRPCMAQATALITGQKARPTVSDPGSVGGLPCNAKFGLGPDSTGSLAKSLMNLPESSPGSSQRSNSCSGASPLPDAGPGGGGEVSREEVKSTSDPGRAGSLLTSVPAASSPVVAGGPDGVGSLPKPLEKLPPILPESSQRRSSSVFTPSTAHPGGGGAAPHLQATAASCPDGAGGIPRSVTGRPSLVGVGGPDGAGSLPIVSPPPGAPHLTIGGNGTGGIRLTCTPSSLPSTLPSPAGQCVSGLVFDASTRRPIAGAPVVVIDVRAGIASVTVTDELGQFIAYIDNAAGLDLAIPTEGIAGISVAPGDILEIAVP